MFQNEPLGWQLVQQMKQENDTAPIPIILCTANPAMIKPLEQYLIEKDISVVIKPFDLDDLLEAAKKGLELSSN